MTLIIKDETFAKMPGLQTASQRQILEMCQNSWLSAESQEREREKIHAVFFIAAMRGFSDPCLNLLARKLIDETALNERGQTVFEVEKPGTIAEAKRKLSDIEGISLCAKAVMEAKPATKPQSPKAERSKSPDHLRDICGVQ